MGNIRVFKIHIVAVFIAFSASVHAQSVQHAKCNVSAISCSECLEGGPYCGWCTDRNSEWEFSRKARCGSKDQLKVSGCQTVDFPRSSAGLDRLNNPLSNTVQVHPQRFKVKLRPDDTQSVTFQVRPAPDYPLDVYYLMDLSFSMRDDKETLLRQSNSLSEALRDISKNSRLGYGSFVEKPIEPFSVAYGPRALVPCEKCRVPFVFENVVPLNENISVFQDSVSSLLLSANIDDPEDSLSGLVQASVCREAIGWKEGARRVLLLASDAGYHIAGEGRLAGIIQPNDGLCHLHENKYYTEGLTQDYPSIGLLKHVLEHHSVLPIFAVTTDSEEQYQALSDELPGSSVILLHNDSSNIVRILKAELERLASITNLTALPYQGVTIRASAQCPVGEPVIGPHGLPFCRNMSVGLTANFTVHLTGGSCEEMKHERVVTFRVLGFGDVNITVEPVCHCGCESKVRPNSERCGNGLYNESCGVCHCPPEKRSYRGVCCNETAGESGCYDPSSDVECNGKGVCECGVCVCHEDQDGSGVSYYGRYCECNNQNCPANEDGAVCSGLDRGVCDCGTCKCLPQFNGTACECRLDGQQCRNSEGEICSGNGRCDCNCVCEEGYEGKFCQVCKLVKCKNICDRSVHCLTCKDNLEEGCEKCSSSVVRTVVPPTEEVYTIDTFTAKRCPATDADDCDFYYWVAQRTDGSLTTLHQEDIKDCPEDIDYLPIILAIIFGMLLLGILLLLLWKVYAHYRDKKEYQRFLQERNKQLWGQDESPLFKPAITKYENPQYQPSVDKRASATPDSTSKESDSKF